MPVLSIWTPKSSTTNVKSSENADSEPSQVMDVTAKPDLEDNAPKDSVDALGSTSPIGADTAEAPLSPTVDQTVASVESNATSAPESAAKLSPSKERPAPSQPRFSFRSLGFFYGSKSAVTQEQDASERHKASDAAKRESLSIFSRSSDRRAQRNALAVQKLIVGPTSIAPTNSKTQPVSRAQLTKIKSELMNPKSANLLIAKLRALPTPEGPIEEKGVQVPPALAKSGIPIHAVCLESTEAEVQDKHFSKLEAASVATASLAGLTALFNELHIVNLLAAPDLGLGQPGDGEGLLAGAVPTAETVIEGAVKLTPQLMALGYATGKAILPDHAGVHPPTDRMSVLTYWWGLELCLPPPTLKHLAQAPSIAHQVINFLSALSLMNEGVREVLPFVRYIGQFVDFEWTAIQKQDKGKGVVCAATWVMPAAMVPRPWDFPDASPAKDDKPDTTEAPRTGQGVVEDIIPVSTGLLPSLLVTPPSVIKNTPAQDASSTQEAPTQT